MARYSSGVKSGAGSTTLPLASLYAGASCGAKIKEIGITNTTSVAVDVKLVRLTTTGTQGAAQTAAKADPDAATASCSFRTTHSVAPTLGDDLGYRATLGASGGSGVIWTFEEPLRIAPGTTNGIGVIVENGTGQACQIDFVWFE